MTDRIGYRVEGLSAVVRALRAIGVEVDDLKGAFSRIAREGATLAAGFTPRRSGRLAGSARGNRAQSKAVVTVGRSTIPYAGPINYGWHARNIAPSRFMQRADLALRPRALHLLNEEIDRTIRRKGLEK